MNIASTAMVSPKGWGRPMQSRRFHYFDNNSMSLCRKWGFYFGDAEDTHDDHTDNCAVCQKLVRAVRKREAAE
jgi:hypothetical protein